MTAISNMLTFSVGNPVKSVSVNHGNVAASAVADSETSECFVWPFCTTWV